MTDATMTSRRSGLAYFAPRLGLWLVVLALVLLAIAPIGYHAGLWHFRTAFFTWMQYSAYAAAAGAVISLLSLLLGWGRIGGGGRIRAVLGLVIGGFLIYWPIQFYAKLYPLPIIGNTPLPIIHDITTDMTDPPAFSASVVQEREGEQGNAVTYDPKVGEQQKAAYSDIGPVKTGLPPEEAFRRALATAQAMSGWVIDKSDPATGRIEGRQSSLFFRFTDDFVIRVMADGAGSRIDMRSESRQGRSDFGVNAARIRAYLSALQQHLG